jgi:lipoyl(octanoyl) transferase
MIEFIFELPREILIKRHTAKDPWTYEALDYFQRNKARLIKENNSPGVILLSELKPVITLGRRRKVADLSLKGDEYDSQGIDLFETDRGGCETYQGPGQWVVFVIDRLDRMTGDSMGVRKMVDGLLNIGSQLFEKFNLKTQRKHDQELGLWTEKGKIASVGIHVQEGIVLHGLSLNIHRTAQSFYGINPCGLKAKSTYLKEEIETWVVGDSLMEQAQLILASNLRATQEAKSYEYR